MANKQCGVNRALLGLRRFNSSRLSAASPGKAIAALKKVQQRRSVSRVPERTGPKTMSGDACETRGLFFELRALATLQIAHLSPFWAMTQYCESAY
jgi:hypothetical protein